MASIRQPSFAGGELSPTLYGRTDLTKHAAGAKRLKNLFVTKGGGAMSRPGTVASTQAKASSHVRLIPFIYSATQSFVLQFNSQRVRVIQNGVQLGNGLGGPLEIVVPYNNADLFDIQYAQQGAVLTLTHKGYPPAELTWDGTNWSYSAISFDRPATSGWATHCPCIVTPDTTATTTEALVEWQWQVTQIRKDARGTLYETAPTVIVNQATVGGGTPPSLTTSAMPGQCVVSVAHPITIVLSNLGAGLYANTNLIAHRIYRGRGGLMGWVGDHNNSFNSGQLMTFTDYGIEPDYTQPPPKGENPFKFYDSSGTLIATEYPAAVGYFEGRRVFAGSSSLPGSIWLSASDDYSNFDSRLIPVEDESLRFDIGSRRREEIRSVVGLSRLVELTSDSIWAGAGYGGPLGPDNPDFKLQSELGASTLTPLVIDNSILYARSKGTGVRELTYDYARQKFDVTDLSLISEHFFIGHKVVDWCFAEDPWGLVWAVRDDGILLTLTFLKDQELWAWTQHDTQGTVMSVCSVPEGTEDAVYLAVTRGGVGFIERMATRVITDATQAICLDCAFVYDGSPTTAISYGTIWDSATFAEVYGLADGVVVGPFTRAAGDTSLTLDEAASHVILGLTFTPQFQALDPAVQGQEVRTRVKQVRRVSVEVDSSRGLSVGPDFDNLTEWKEREVSDEYGAMGLKSTMATINIAGGWDRGGSVCIQQNAPLPLTILGITREVEFGDED